MTEGDPPIARERPPRKKLTGQGALATLGDGWTRLQSWPPNPPGPGIRPSQWARIEAKYGPGIRPS